VSLTNDVHQKTEIILREGITQLGSGYNNLSIRTKKNFGPLLGYWPFWVRPETNIICNAKQQSLISPPLCVMKYSNDPNKLFSRFFSQEHTLNRFKPFSELLRFLGSSHAFYHLSFKNVSKVRRHIHKAYLKRFKIHIHNVTNLRLKNVALKICK